jgi:hypothetical protein
MMYKLTLPTDGARTHEGVLDPTRPIFLYSLDQSHGMPPGNTATITNVEATNKPPIWQYRLSGNPPVGHYQTAHEALAALEERINREDLIKIGDIVWAQGQSPNAERFRVIEMNGSTAKLKLIARRKDDGTEVELAYTADVPVSMLHKIA